MPVRSALVALVMLLAAPGPAPASGGGGDTYVVVYERGARLAASRAAVRAAGGRIVRENKAVGVATVRAKRRDFAARAARSRTILSAARNQPIGRARPKPDPVEDPVELRAAPRARRAAPGEEPLASWQWNMAMMGATSAGSYARQVGSHDVKVAVLDSGVQGNHPDIAPNFDAALSRNFVTDIPAVDGPCEVPSCVDPPDVDDDGHGTHVAGIIGSALNGVGIGGVAPGVGLVNLRTGQDSGYFFLQPTVDALTFAGDHGIDVVNMSYYVDPWLFNCPSDPEQAGIIAAVQRALDYARQRGVTLVSASGNEATDLGRPTVDDTSPDYPPGSARHRDIDNSCLNLPTEGEGVLAVNAVGPSARKAYYSNYGVEQSTVAAPGGDDRDTGGVPRNLILAPYPSRALGQRSDADGDGRFDIDGSGNPTLATIMRAGDDYWQWLEGTSMASPHAAGVAALAVAQHGRADPVHGGRTLEPAEVERIVRAGAVDMACPVMDSACEGDAAFNGYFGDGVVSALGTLDPPPPGPPGGSGTPPASAPAGGTQPPDTARLAPRRVSVKLRARRRGRGLRLTVSGTLTPPSGRDACAAGGRLAVRVQNAKRMTLAGRAPRLGRDCRFRATVRFARRARLGRSLRVRVSFGGNARLTPRRAPLGRVKVPR